MCDLMKSDNDDEMLIFHQQQSFFLQKNKKILKSNPFEKIKVTMVILSTS